MPACALSLILQKPWILGGLLTHATCLSANALQTIPNGKPGSACALSLPARSHSQTPDQSPLTCSIPFSEAHAALWQAWRGYSPHLRQFCCALYSPGVSDPIGLQQASHGSNSQQQAACLKLQPALYTISPTLQLLVLEATYQQYLLAHGSEVNCTLSGVYHALATW